MKSDPGYGYSHSHGSHWHWQQILPGHSSPHSYPMIPIALLIHFVQTYEARCVAAAEENNRSGMTMGFARFASRHVPSHDGQLPFALVGLFLSYLLEEGFTFMQGDFHKRPRAKCMVSQVMYMMIIIDFPTDDPEFHDVTLFHKITMSLV